MAILEVFHVDLEYTHIGYTCGKLKDVKPVLLRIGEHSEILERYVLSVENENGEINEYLYYVDKKMIDLKGKNLSFEGKFREGAPINEILYIYRFW
ncbi:UNVERIFIED_ORG: hypothetical protein C7430_101938 [Pantoea agglomerans]|uniref:Uncharacterized protein n=1 Tax=Enterobacter agglomerans TaxID=549 RepID=A0ABD6XX03_ENTAG